ncbi:MAG: hypothetical protein IPG92_10950 [Flavobacteriales bacterium]|nr:hypothetical protein [Flavobacteriales bacterium]
MDAILAVLMQSGHLSARLNGQPLKLSELDQKKTGQAEFRQEHPVLTVAQKLRVRTATKRRRRRARPVMRSTMPPPLS